MATVTFPLSQFGDNLVTVELRVNDANWRISQVVCTNNSAYPAKATILENGVQRFTATAPAGQTTTWPISGVQLGWDSVNGGIQMGGYVMQIQWPA